MRFSQENKKPSLGRIERAYLEITHTKSKFLTGELLFASCPFFLITIAIESHLVFV